MKISTSTQILMGFCLLTVGCNAIQLSNDYLFVATPMNWHDAQTHCVSLGGHLATINSAAENAAARAASGTHEFWIGLHDTAVEGLFEWIDGSTGTYRNWNNGEPNDAQGQEDCAHFRNNVDNWNDLPCSAQKRFLCQNTDKVYHMVDSSMTWDDAETHCNGLGGHLASIHSAEQDAYLSDVANGADAWIGFHDVDAEATWVWSDGTPNDYTNWHNAQPDNAGNNQDCALINWSGSFWDDQGCSSSTHPFICYAPAPRRFEVEFFNDIGVSIDGPYCVQALQTPDVAAWYAYAAASFNGLPAFLDDRRDRMTIHGVQTPDGELNYAIVLDGQQGGGGELDVTFQSDAWIGGPRPDIVRDDNGDAGSWDVNTGTLIGEWRWWDCCTDGVALNYSHTDISLTMHGDIDHIDRKIAVFNTEPTENMLISNVHLQGDHEIIIRNRCSPECPKLCRPDQVDVCRQDQHHGNWIFTCQEAAQLDDIAPGFGGLDCLCQPKPTFAPTSSPTQVPTLPPTQSPTAPPTSTPTLPPTDAPTTSPTLPPTEVPTLPPTNAPSLAPTTSPTCAPWGMGELEYMCHEDAHGVVEAGLFNEPQHGSYEHDTWFPGHSNDGIDYDCDCDAVCEDADIVTHAIVHPDFSAFDNDTFHYCIALPKDADDSALYFLGEDGLPLPVFGCDSTNDAGGPNCAEWSAVSYNGFQWGGECFDTFCVEVPWKDLTPHLMPLQKDWDIMYFGAIHSDSKYNRSACMPNTECDDYVYTRGTNHLWEVSVPIHIMLHIYNFRVYDYLRLIDYVITESVIVSEFSEGFDSTATRAYIRFRTMVQWPAKLEDSSFTFGQAGTTTAVLTQISDCQDIGAGHDFDAAYNASVTQNAPATYPEACYQNWLIEVGVTDPALCVIEDTYRIDWDVVCQPSFDTDCPFTHAYDNEPLYSVLEFGSDDFCEYNDINISVSGDMAAFGCDDDCACDYWNYVLDHFDSDDVYQLEFIYLEAYITSPELTITGTSVMDVSIDMSCTADGSFAMYHFYNESGLTTEGQLVDFTFDDSPASVCSGDHSTVDSVAFNFHFNPDFFIVDLKHSCEFHIWATVEVSYLGFDNPALLEMSQKFSREDLTQAKLNQFTLLEGDVASIQNTAATPPSDAAVTGSGTLEGAKPTSAASANYSLSFAAVFFVGLITLLLI